MAKLKEINKEDQKHTKPVVDENQKKLKDVAEEKVGETEVYKFDYDFGCVRFRGLKVRRGRDLHLNVFDDVDSVSLKKRNVEISALKKQIATPGESEIGGISAAAATNSAYEGCKYKYATVDGRLIPVSGGWKGLDGELNLYNHEDDATGCGIM